MAKVNAKSAPNMIQRALRQDLTSQIKLSMIHRFISIVDTKFRKYRDGREIKHIQKIERSDYGAIRLVASHGTLTAS